MRPLFLLPIIVSFAAPAFAAPAASKPELTAKPAQITAKPVTTATAQVQALQDFVPPDSGKRWRVVRVDIGNVFLSQMESTSKNHSLEYRGERRALKLNIYNPSMLSAASIRIDCASGKVPPSLAGVQTLAKQSYKTAPILPDGDRGAADCQVASDRPILVFAQIEETISYNYQGGYNGQALDTRITPWPTFRLDGPQ